MTEHHNRRFLGIGELGRRLVAAFVGVALAGIVADMAITSVTATAEFKAFVSQQEVKIAQATAIAARDSYTDHGGWHSGQLSPVLELASQFDARVRVTDSAAKTVASSPGFAGLPSGPAVTAPVLAAKSSVGTVTIKFDHHGLVAAAAQLEAERWRARIYGAAIGVLLALVVSVLVSTRITRPLDTMLATMRARGAGDRDIRIKDMRAIGVLRELLQGFNKATDSFDRQDRANRNLVADAAHELRTPVAVLQAGHEAILDGITEPTPENLNSLRDEVLRLSQILEGLSTLAAAEAAALQLRRGPHDLADIAADAATELRDAFEIADLKLIRQLSRAETLCDDCRTREITTNLLTNALKYTPAGGMVTLETGLDEANHPRLRVSDTGIGIPDDELPRVTERFFRGRNSPRVAAGSGFGLTIVAELVRAHHGELKITSEPGKGTQVTITLPPGAPARELGYWRSSGAH